MHDSLNQYDVPHYDKFGLLIDLTSNINAAVTNANKNDLT